MANILEKETRREDALRKKRTSRVVIWGLAILLLGGSVWGLAKLVQKSSSGGELAGAITSQDWVQGNREAKIVLVEYGDFQCPACAAYFPIVEQLHQDFGDELAFVYRHFPLMQIHAQAEPAARAAEAAGRQDKFWEMYGLLYAKQKDWAGQSNAEETFLKYAQGLDLDLAKYKNDFSSEEVRNRVKADYSGGLGMGLNSTPTFFLNGKRVQPRNYEEFRSIIQQSLAGNS